MDKEPLSGLDARFIRADRLPLLQAALAWGIPRCHSPAERSLLPPLLIFLSELNATVTPVERDSDGDAGVDLRITLSRPSSGPVPVRIRFAVLSDCIRAPRGEGFELIQVCEDDCCREPWAAAAGIAARILALASGGLTPG